MNPERGFPLAVYMQLGGNLLLVGNEVLSRTKFEAIPELFGFAPHEFGYQYLHIESEFDGGQVVAGGFLRPRGNATDQRIDGMDGAHPTAAAAAEGWPELLVAKEPYTGMLLGMPRIEGMVKGYQHGDRPGRLDTLYTTVTNGSRWRPVPIPSRLDDAPSAFRYSGPDQGKIMAFAFPVFWWSDGAADSLGTRAIEGFFDERP